LNTIANDVPSSNNIEYYAKVVKDKYLRRNMMDAADRLRDSVQDDDIDSIESISAAISSLTDGLAIGGTNPDASHSLDMLKQSIDEFKASTNGLLGVSTGIGELDDKIYGMRSGHFGVLSAYSSTGKSAFALNMVASFIKQGKKVVFFSLEMSGAEIMARLISIISGVPTWVVQRGCSDDSQKELVLNAIKLIKDSGMRTYTDSSWNTIQMTMLKESVGNKADMFVLDYIQLVTSEEKSDYARLSRVAKELQKNLQRFKVPMLCLSQISNEQAKDMNPFIMSTKGAGDIAASADWVLLLQNAEQDMEIINKLKDEKIPLPIKCFIQKHRHGPTGMLSLNFETITGRFLDKNTYDESRYKNKLIQIHGSQSEFALQKEFEDFS
jgi:replicative DNA helicase